jgi:hypothetical protein
MLERQKVLLSKQRTEISILYDWKNHFRGKNECESFNFMAVQTEWINR